MTSGPRRGGAGRFEGGRVPGSPESPGLFRVPERPSLTSAEDHNLHPLRVVYNDMTPGHLAAWAQWMVAAGMSRRTINDRIRLVAQIECETGHDPVTADWRALADFLADDRFKPGTRQTYYAHLCAWFKWLVLMDVRLDDPTQKLKSPKAPRRLPRPVTVDQLGTMLRTRQHHRTRAMILLGAYEGFRVSEIARVRGDHISEGKIHVVGKGGVEADLPLHDLVAEIAETMPKRGFWFPSHTRLGPVHGKSVSTIISNVMTRAEVPPVKTPHSLRHFFGTHVLRGSGNIRVAQELMRHATPGSTAIYTEIDWGERLEAINGLPIPRDLRAA